MPDFDPLLENALHVKQIDGGVFTKVFPDGWQQGRGAFGGIVLGSIARAMEGCEKESDRILRSFTGEIFAPVLPIETSIKVEPLKIGSGVSTYRASLSQNGEPLAVATGVFGRHRVEMNGWSDLPPPPLAPAAADLPPLPIGPPIGPEFARAFDFRSAGPLPFTGGNEQIAHGWAKAKSPPKQMGAAELIAMVDTFWPSSFATATMPRPMATVAFTFQHFPVAPLDPNEPLFYRAKTVAGLSGYLSEIRELWSPRGELVAINPQTFVCIK